ncbi:Beta-galactosidase [Cucumis melo var. makuwa]|uniref:Beta-galactosidase n=1 Tax=Cucumis melo var. makuwa TaxID=1194695 RepID=A0A5A7VKM9_CUCMM|nr:Beta-galactosidase [Cucumis melo var. makuwa]
MDLCRETVWDTPNDGTQYARLEDADRVYDFLAGFNPKFDTVCGGKKQSSNEKQNSGRAYISEITHASTFQSTSPTASQTKTPTLGAIAQSADGSLAPIAGKGQIVPFDGFALQNVLHNMSSGRTIGTVRHSIEFYILDDDTSCSSFSKKPSPCGSSSFPQLSTSLPSYLWGDAILTAAHLINKMSSHILHLQIPLDCLKESYPSTRLVPEVPLCVFGCTAYVHNFGPYQTKFTPRAQVSTLLPVSHLQGKSVSEESNSTFEFIEPTPSTVFDVDPHPIIPPTNQVPWKTYYMRSLKKKVRSPTSQSPAPVQNFEPPRDQGMENPTEPCTNNTMSENDRSDVAVLENVEEKNRGDETEFRAFTANLDSTIIPKNIYTTLECPEWKNTVMEEMKAHTLPKGHKTIGCKWVFSLKYKIDGILDRHKARLCGGSLHEPPPGFEAQFGQQVCKLQKSLYGLKQSPRHSLTDSLPLSSPKGTVKDGQTEISQLKQRMGDEFEIKDLGNLKYFLGMKVARSKEGNSDDQVPVDKEQYQRLVGKLIYLSHTRPNISFIVSVVSQFMQTPYEKHMEVVNRILRYLRNTPGKGLMFRKTNRKTFKGYTDSNWTESVVDRKSTSGYCTFVWGNLVTWRSKKQSVVARSSAEAEYRVMSLGICEEIWLQKVLSDLHQECETPLKLFCDNKAAISIANNPIQHDRTKYVEIDRHFIKERLDSGNICISYIPSSQQVVDVLTKGLLRPYFDLCVSKLGLIDIYVPT